ncbi:MAG: ATP-binding cassette domain-containing protein [Clostridium chrysemydis]|uniref:ATP-binding cassette domain-containing protein n=1 Tax=Clostridium chrysemydis TaxID=2665504 RepID=UPI003F2F4305
MGSLVLNKINKSYNKKSVLKDVSLDIKGTYGLLGPNGAGKTTLMRIISTLLQKDSGSINYENLDWSNEENVRDIIGYLPQHFSMYPGIKVKDMLSHIAILKGVKENRESIIDNLIEDLNLREHSNKKIKELSGGMLRRVGIAQALLGEPKIIIIDEPTAGLDIEERVRFRELLRKIGKDRIIIISTHIVDDIEYTCQNIGVLKKGEVITSGSRSDILKFAEGKVFEIDVELHGEDYNYISENYKIVSNKNIDAKKVLIRYIANNKYKNSKEVNPSLEDSYLYLVGETI